jgi:hypothetical protein
MRFTSLLFLALVAFSGSLCGSHYYAAPSGGALTYTQQGSPFGTNVAVGSNLGNGSSTRYVNGTITIGVSTFTCTKVRLVIGRSGTGAPLLTGYIWADSAGVPGTLLATSTNTVDGTTLATGGGDADFLFSGVSLVNGTTYWVGASASAIDAANYNTIRGGSTSSGLLYRSPDGTTWSNTGVTRIINATLYSSP